MYPFIIENVERFYKLKNAEILMTYPDNKIKGHRPQFSIYFVPVPYINNEIEPILCE